MFGKKAKEKNKIAELKKLKESVMCELQMTETSKDYLVGYYNGLEFSISLLEEREPIYCAMSTEQKAFETKQEEETKRTPRGIISGGKKYE